MGYIKVLEDFPKVPMTIPQDIKLFFKFHRAKDGTKAWSWSGGDDVITVSLRYNKVTFYWHNFA